MDIAEKILLLRRKLGISQEELAQRSGVTRVTVNLYEHGKRNPKRDQLIKLCRVLSIPSQDMAECIKEVEIKKGQELGQKKAEDFLNHFKD